jgi:hypothetical protein
MCLNTTHLKPRGLDFTLTFHFDFGLDHPVPRDINTGTWPSRLEEFQMRH